MAAVEARPTVGETNLALGQFRADCEHVLGARRIGEIHYQPDRVSRLQQAGHPRLHTSRRNRRKIDELERDVLETEHPRKRFPRRARKRPDFGFRSRQSRVVEDVVMLVGLLA